MVFWYTDLDIMLFDISSFALFFLMISRNSSKFLDFIRYLISFD